MGGDVGLLICWGWRLEWINSSDDRGLAPRRLGAGAGKGRGGGMLW